MNAILQIPCCDESAYAFPETENEKVDFEALVENHYSSLYRFALSLTQSEAEACDLTQQTFYLWAKKGHQLRDSSKAKTWLFTTLHRSFLGIRRHETRFPHYEIAIVDPELPVITPDVVEHMDSSIVLKSLTQIDELHRIPLILFYLENHSYQEIADILKVKIGTVMSRLSRGKEQLRQILSHRNRGLMGKLYF